MSKKEKDETTVIKFKKDSKIDSKKELVSSSDITEVNDKLNSSVNKKRVVRRRKKNSDDNSEMITRNYDLSLFEVIIIIFITGISVSIASGLIVYNNYYKLSGNSNSIPSDEELVGDSPLETFENNYKYIVNSYVGEVDKDALIDAAIEAMYEELGDKYTFYMDESDSNDLMEQVNGKYEGFGIQILTSYDKYRR